MAPRSSRPLRVVNREVSAFGSALRDRRQTDGMTQAELADRFDVRQQTIGAWERGSLKPQRRFFPELAQYLDLSGPDEVRQLLAVEPPAGRAPERSEARTVNRGTATADPNWPRVIADLTDSVSERVRQGPLSRTEVALFRELLEYASQKEVDGD